MLVDVGVGAPVGFAGDNDLDDSLDPREVRADREVRVKE